MVDAELERSAMRRIGWRLVPFLILAYFISFLDRVNVGFAAIQMNKDLGMTATVFGWGAGIFFLGYFLMEIPSNLMLERFGAPPMSGAAVSNSIKLGRRPTYRACRVSKGTIWLDGGMTLLSTTRYRERGLAIEPVCFVQSVAFAPVERRRVVSNRDG